MGLFDLFRTENVDGRLAYLRQLIRVAKADGKLEEAEYKFIQRVAARLETTEQELDELQNDQDVSMKLGVQTPEERFQFLWDLVWVMAVDEDIDVNEVHICSRVAYRLGFKPAIVKQMAEHIEKERKTDDSPEEHYRRAFSGFQSSEAEH